MRISVIVAVVYCLLMPRVYAQPKEIVQVGWELWYPYQYENDENQLIGLDIEITEAVLRLALLEPTYTELPWKRHLLYIRSGDYDLAMGASYSEERSGYAYFSIPYRQEVVRLYTRKDIKLSLNELAQLTDTNYMIGVEAGYYYGKAFEQLMAQANFKAHISEVVDLEQNVSMLLKGRIDGLLADPVAMRAFLERKQHTNEFVAHPLAIYQTDIHYMLSKASTSERTKVALDNAIMQLKKSGELQKIMNRWSLQE